MFIVLIAAALLGLGFTLVARGAALRLGIVSHPNPIVAGHIAAVPYLGGVGILAGAYVTMWALPLLPWAGHPQAHAEFPTSLLVGGLLFCGVGVFDDVMAFHAGRKFALQVLAIVVTFAVDALTGEPKLIHTLTGWPAVDAIFSALWILAIVNAMNFVDVSDGLAAALSTVLIGVFAWHFSPYAALALTVAGACCGFILLNRAPATVFMGDAGSHFLGFMLGAFTVTESSGSTGWQWLALLGLWTSVPLLELLFLTYVRVQKGLPWWRGSPDHFALRLQAAGLSKNQVALSAAAVGAASSASALVFLQLSAPAQAAFAAACVGVAGWFCLRLVRLEAPS
jgi:UDP-GlcNAc:undecaprenyl-phosphate GlcNAc-1-phosphate transferase